VEKEFTCQWCGEMCSFVTGAGRKTEFIKGRFCDVPEDFPIMTCNGCDETYSSLDETKKLTRRVFALEFKRCCELLNLSDVEIAKTLQISRPTVGRWRRGEATPHDVGKVPVLKFMWNKLDEKGLK
jgi:hypothetical protein